MSDDRESNGEIEDQQAEVLVPVEQDIIRFHGEDIVAVRLTDGRICAVIRWICKSLNLKSNSQIRKLENTSSTVSELVRVVIQTKGGPQRMAAITLKGFPVWMLTVNPNETQDAHIRELIIAYQEEAKDVLYQHFANKSRPALPEPRAAIVQYLEDPGPEASDEELATYHETMSLWHRWKADYHNQELRRKILHQQEALVEEDQEMGGLISGIQKRLGPEKISSKHQEAVQEYVNAWSDITKKNRGIIYTALHARFRVPRYQELLEADWPAIEEFFRRQFPGGVLPVIQQTFNFDQTEEA